MIDPRGALLKGALWTVATRWSIKGIGFINTVIMARVLVPDDYGLVAMATLVVGAFQALLDFGATTAVLRKSNPNEAEVHSAWTLRLVQCATTAALVLCVSPFASDFFEDGNLVKVLWALAAGMAILGFQSMSTTLALQQYQFNIDYKVNVSAKLASVAITLALGFWLKDYRALVGGILAGQVVTVVASYWVHPYRPQWTTTHIAEIWAVTKWLTLANVGTFVLRKGDEVIAGRVANTHDFGLYHVGADLGSLPVMEVGPALLRALLPVLTTIRDDVTRLNKAILKVTAGLNGVLWMLAALGTALSSELTAIILGSQWAEAAVYVAWFSIIIAAQTAPMAVRSYLTLIGKTRTQSATVWSELTAFAFAAAILLPWHGLVGLAMARLLATMVNVLHLFWAMSRYGGPKLSTSLGVLARPLAAFALACGANRLLHPAGIDIGTSLVLGAITAGTTYMFVSFVWWHLAGRREGFESLLVEHGTLWIKQMRRRSQ